MNESGIDRDTDLKQKYDYSPYEGDSAEDVKKRVLMFIEKIKSNYSGKKVLIVAHGGILKMFHYIFKDQEGDFSPKNAEIHEFDI